MRRTLERRYQAGEQTLANMHHKDRRGSRDFVAEAPGVRCAAQRSRVDFTVLEYLSEVGSMSPRLGYGLGDLWDPICRRVSHPKIYTGCAPTTAMIADVKLGWKCALLDLAIDRRPTETGQLNQVWHPKNFVMFGHGKSASKPSDTALQKSSC